MEQSVSEQMAPSNQGVLYWKETYHGVGKGCRHSNQHPPYNSHKKLFAVAFYQRLDNGTIHGGHLDRDQGPHNEEETVADQQPGLFAAPAGNDDAQQFQQAPKEFPVELDLFLLLGRVLGLVLAGRGSATFGALGGFAARGSLLLGDGIAHAVDQGDKQGQVDGAGDAGAVLQIQRGELGHDASDSALALARAGERGQREFGLGRHDWVRTGCFT